MIGHAMTAEAPPSAVGGLRIATFLALALACSAPDRQEPTVAQQQCVQASDCMVVDAHCGGCCDWVAISKAEAGVFLAAKNAACEGYRGEQCRCSIPDLVAFCSNGTCIFKPFSVR